MSIAPENFLTHSLREFPKGENITRILGAALQAVEPGAAVKKFLRRDGDHLFVSNEIYDLAKYKRVQLVGAGKAGASMASAVANVLGNYLTHGVIIVKKGHLTAEDEIPIKIILHQASHPVPGEDGIEGTKKLIKSLQSADETDLILCVISGGGSALLTSPAPGISLSDLQSLTSLLLNCGATIQEINTLRKHLDQVKGGGLLSFAPKSQWIVLVLSDVVGDPLDKIASGPTVPDPSTFNDAYLILEKYGIQAKTPLNILTHLRLGLNGSIPETLKLNDFNSTKIKNIIVGNNALAASSALEQARREGFHSMVLTNYLQGESCQVGRVLAAITRQLATSNQPIPLPACVILGGETTVNIRGKGMGGRNQELALSAVEDLSGLENSALITLATDGGDGPTDAAGAVVTGSTYTRATSLGLNPVDFLMNNDSYSFFKCLDDLIKTGPTLTNVNDLAFIIVC